MIIVDYEVGNIGSIINILKKVGIKARLSSDVNEIANAEKLILPGVGAFDNGMKALKKSGLLDTLNKKVLEKKTPILGICLGMQLLLESSEEGKESGLGWIPGKVRKFTFDNNDQLKIPHMGWNIVEPINNDYLFKGFQDEIRFYFVHSYYADVEQKYVLGTTKYGKDFTSSIFKDNIYGVQFHPEKSHKYGMQLLKNFGEL